MSVREEARALAATCTIYQEWACNNDTNGNPRRAVIGWNADGRIVLGGELGYEGANQVLEALGALPPDITYIGRVYVSSWRGVLDVAQAHDSRMPWRIVWDDGDHHKFVASESSARKQARDYNRIMGKPNRQTAERVS